MHDALRYAAVLVLGFLLQGQSICANFSQSRVGRLVRLIPRRPFFLRGHLRCLRLFLLAAAAKLSLQAARSARLL